MQKIRQDMALGENLRQLRMNKGYTQELTITKMQLMGCQVSRSIYAQMESGTYNIRVSELVALRRIFECDYADFFAGLEES